MQKRQLFRSLMKRKDREDFAAVFEIWEIILYVVKQIR